MDKRAASSPLSDVRVLIVSNDDETIDGTQAYLSRVGASAKSVARLGDVVARAANVQAVVLFADDYARASAMEVVEVLRKTATSTAVIVVSEQVESFALVGAGESRGMVTVLRRPTWGWMLLEAIRSQLRPNEEQHS